MEQIATIDSGLVQMEHRQVMYGLLGRVFEDTLSLTHLQSISSPPQRGVLLGLQQVGVASDSIDRLLERSSGATKKAVDSLRAEYDAVFRSEGCIYASASCWAAGGPAVTGPAWERALDFYRRHGVSVRSDCAHIADHAGFELYVAALLAGRACEACDADQVEKECAALRELLDAHLLPWMPDFLQAVEHDERARFYREAARTAREFLEFDWRQLERYPGSAAFD
jgi:TorA maturation chaperone TorD